MYSMYVRLFTNDLTASQVDTIWVWMVSVVKLVIIGISRSNPERQGFFRGPRSEY